ncbi:MAG: PAC2 family protein, partial [Chloroflexi bacterium]|nr:PAC2 family protein [Chloroflexota bacterium]
MDELVELSERPAADEIYMLAGWRQWADAGATSSALPQYLIDQTGAKKIGQIKSDPFYLFQFPGTHHLLRPEIKMEEGYPREVRSHRNEFFYTGDSRKGLVIFTGDEPHLGIERYADALFDAAQALKVRRVAAVGGVYASVPYDKDRHVSCTYSLRRMKGELSEYAVRFSNYEGGVSIGSYLAKRAELRGLEYFAFYAFVPMYDFSQLSPMLQGVSIEQDYKAWHDIMQRLNHMFDLRLDLPDLEQQSEQLTASMEAKIKEIQKKMPQLQVSEYLRKLTENFTEMS